MRMNSRNRCARFPLTTAFVAASATLALLAGPVGALAAEKVIVGSPNPRGMSSGMANIYLAVHNGYFKQEGLDVEFVNFNGTAVLLPQIASKRVTIGWPNADTLIISSQPGRDHLPIRFFYNLMRRSVWEIVVPAKSPIKRIADLKGKKIGVGALTWNNIPTTKAILREVGLKVGTSVDLVPVGVGGTAFRAIKTGQVDALNLFDTMHDILESTGTKIRRLQIAAKYTGLFSNGYVTHADTIKNNPRMLAGFGRAIAKGTVACYADLEACVKAYYAVNPSKRPKPGKEARTTARNIRILKTRGQSYLSFAKGGKRQFGAYPIENWKNYVAVLHSQGILKTDRVPVENLFTNRFVAAFNDFDAEALRRKARAK